MLAQDLGRKWAMYDTVRWPLASVPLDQPFHDSQRRQAVPPQQEKVVVRLWRLDAEHLGPHPAPRTTPRQLPARRGSSAYGLQSHLAHTLSAVPLMLNVFSQTLTNHGAGCCVLAQAAARSRRRGRWCRRSWSTRFWAVASQRSIPRQPGPGRAACQVLVAACCCRGTWRSANASCVCADLKSKWELLIRTASQEAHIIKSQEYILTLHASMPRH